MRDVLLLGSVPLASVVAAWTSLAFCGLRSRQIIGMSVVIGLSASVIYGVLAYFEVILWVQVALVLCLVIGCLLFCLRKQDPWRAVPALCLFGTCWMLDRVVSSWIWNSDSIPTEYLKLFWLLFMIGGAFAIQSVFTNDVWDKARNRQAEQEQGFRLALKLLALYLGPAILSFILWMIGPQHWTLAGGTSVLAVLCMLALALVGGRLLLCVEQKDRELMVSHRAQQELYQFMSVIRSQRHDYNLHLHTIAGLIRDGQYEKGQEYIASIVSDSQDVNVMMKIREPIVGALISGYYDIAREQGIELELHIEDDLGSIVSTAYDTNRILGNLLQNALEEVAKHDVQDKRIILTTLRRGGNSVIRVSNAVQDPERVEHFFEYGFSSKTAHEGIGLNSVMRILELYRGVIYYEINGIQIEVIVRIPNHV